MADEAEIIETEYDELAEGEMEPEDSVMGAYTEEEAEDETEEEGE